MKHRLKLSRNSSALTFLGGGSPWAAVKQQYNRKDPGSETRGSIDKSLNTVK